MFAASRIVPVSRGRWRGRRSAATASFSTATRVARMPLVGRWTLDVGRSLGLAATFLFLLARAAGAQGFGAVTESRRGIWFGGGLGHGWTHLSCSICGGDRESGGYAGYVRAGGTLTPRFLVGGELDAWYRNGEELTEHVEALSVTGYFYPSELHGWFLKLGLGYARYRASQEDEALAAGIPSIQVGGGYEMRVSPRLSIVPFVTLLATPNGNLDRESTAGGGFHADRVATDLNLLVVQFGIGITRH